ncbi:glycosyltransferase involved in cell wall biosynthesis [Bradyrhizobium elkanii]|uniref:glycosyltransferase n=1 Tax=Bradyrhizobium elkanii TaxID=29448 RepID=UPI0008414A0C|nr:glycosyltransferase [Bradyrhizobium elkanii]ODM84489.1 hypothetical protein A6452_17355 [Bradyrhizobium elkanii]ODM86438.1 hypothetical protein A6X20_02065 [Bradyrhizobium elkanii]
MSLSVLILSHMYPRTYYPVGGVFVHEQVKALQRQGVQVAVLSGEPYWISARDPRYIQQALRAWRNEPIRWQRHEGVPVMYFPYCAGGIFHGFVHALTYWQGALRAIDIARARFRFDLIHAHTSFLDGHTAMRLGRRYCCPVVLTEHMGPFSVLTRNKGYRYFTSAAIRGVDRVLAVSRALKQDMIAELGDSARRAEVLGNGFDPDVYAPDPYPGLPHAGTRMLWVGHASAVKGTERLINATARALTAAPGLKLTLMGGGEDLDALKRQVDILGIADHVQFLPSGGRADVAAKMRAHDFLVISSYKETFGLVGLEALACGRPVLTTACGGPEDYVVHGENGLIVPNDEEGLATGILEMANTHLLFRTNQLAATMRETHSWDRIVSTLGTIYQELISAPSPVPQFALRPKPRRILMITTDHLMIDRRILQEAESLRDAGHEVEILAGFECQKPEEYYWRGIRISRFVFDWFDPRAQKLLGLVKYRDNRFWPRLWRTTCKALALLTGITSFEHFVLRQILERQFDVLHVHDYPLLHVGVEVKKRRGCTLVYDAHELYHGQAQLPAATRRRYRRREKRLIREVDAAFTVNPYIAGIMARDYGCPQPHVLLNAAPLVSSTGTTATLRAKLGLSSQARIVLYQGWMSPERGIEALVRAASLFPAGVHLVLIGYGDCERQLREISREQGTDDGRVTFMGRMEPEELAAVTPQADLGVIPYRAVDLNHLYCSPNKLFEFAAAGVPFLANDLPFLRDVAEEYGFGVVADLSAPSVIAEAVASALGDPDRFSELKAAAQAAAVRLNWNVEKDKLLEVYARLPAERGGLRSRAVASGSREDME